MFQTMRYAVGVVFQSPGSRRSRAPWVHGVPKTFTPQALYRVVPPEASQIVQRLRRNAMDGNVNPGCAARPWALEFNRFAVGIRKNAHH